jgi:hypothetical protein
MKKILSSLLLLLIFVKFASAQAQYQPYSYQFYQKLNSDVYSTKTRIHSSLKSYIIDSALQHKYDSLMNYGVDTTGHHSWLYRKLFNEHLFDDRTKEYTFFADYLPDLTIGRDFSGHRTTWLNTRGYQLSATVGKSFYFYSSGFENQAVFPEYLTTYINQVGMIPGQAYDRTFGRKNTKDWSDVTAIVSYTPSKYINFTAGQDKTFIGDGYRSEILSDFASAYPFFKITANLGNVRYMAMWAYMNDPASPSVQYINGYQKKWGAFHYLDWNVNNRLSLGFFDAVIWADRDTSGRYHGFDFSYGNPVIFLRPVEASNGSPGNAIIGFTGKYKLSDGITAYGQFVLDEFESKSFFSGDGSSRNKYSYQLGIRGADLFKVNTLNYLLEFNGARPYTYSEQQPIINYTEESEPLAHPFGANYQELVGLLNYSYKRFDFSGEFDYGHYGLDINGINYGKDLFQSYLNPAHQLGNYIGQGLTTNMYYLEGKVAYMLNPKYNLRIELGGTYRQEINAQFNDKTTMITIGLRSSFRTLYTDLASYKTH